MDLTPMTAAEMNDARRRLRLLAIRAMEAEADAAIRAGELGEPLTTEDVRVRLRELRRG